MQNFYITVSNGLLTVEHRNRIGTAIWEFLWLLDKITKVDDEELGWILGGKPINLSDLAEQMGTSEDTVSRNLNRLQDEGYIKIIRTPRGLSIRVANAKKRFGKNVESEEKRYRKNAERSGKNAVPDTAKMSNAYRHNSKTIQDNTIQQSEQSSQIVDVIDSFKEINPSYEKWFGNTTQRAAISRLLRIHGPPRLKQVISLLPKTNKMQYMPTITTPVQLEDKWASLEAGLIKKKVEYEQKADKNKVAFI